MGIYILNNLNKLAKMFDSVYKQQRIDYDKRFSNTTTFNKIIGFFVFKPRTYYNDESMARYILMLIGPLLIILGVSLILIGLGVIK